MQRIQYDAFISYSSSTESEKALLIKRGLEQLGKKPFQSKFLNIFLDQSNLTASVSLNEIIQKGLDESNYFILLASSFSSKSKWVQLELNYWIEKKGIDRLLICYMEGHLSWDNHAGDFNWQNTNCLPYLLRGKFKSEPLWVDLRHLNKTIAFEQFSIDFRNNLASLSARIKGVSKDSLINEDLKRVSILRKLRNYALLTLSVLLLGSIILGISAYKQRNKALYEAENAAYQEQIAKESLKKALVNSLITSAAMNRENDPSLSLHLFEEAYKKDSLKKEAKRGIIELFLKNPPFSSTLYNHHESINSITLDNDTSLVIGSPSYFGFKISKQYPTTEKVKNSFDSITLSEKNSVIKYLGKEKYLFFNDNNVSIRDTEKNVWYSSSEFNVTKSSISNFVKERFLCSVDSKQRYIFKPYFGFYMGALYDVKKPKTEKFIVIGDCLGGEFFKKSDRLLIIYPREFFSIPYKAFLNRDANTSLLSEKSLRSETNVYSFKFWRSDFASIKISEDESKVFVGTKDGRLIAFNTMGKMLWSKKMHMGAITNIDQKGDFILTVGEDRLANLLNIIGDVLEVYSGHNSPIIGGVLSNDLNTIYTASENGSIRLWKIYNKPTSDTFTIESSKQDLPVFSFDGKLLLVPCSDRKVRIYNLINKEVVLELSHNEPIKEITISRENNYIVTQGRKNTKFWNSNGELLKTLKTKDFGVKPKFASNKAQLAVFSNNDLRFFDYNFNETGSYNFAGDWYNNSTFLNDTHDRLFNIQQRDGLRLGDYNNFLIGYKISVDSSEINVKTIFEILDRRLSRDSAILKAPFSSDNLIIITEKAYPIMLRSHNERVLDESGRWMAYKHETKYEFKDLNSHYGDVLSIDYTKSGEQAVSCGVDGSIVLWDKYGDILATMKPRTFVAKKVLFHPNEKELLIISDKNEFHLLPIDANLIISSIDKLGLSTLSESIKLDYGLE